MAKKFLQVQTNKLSGGLGISTIISSPGQILKERWKDIVTFTRESREENVSYSGLKVKLKQGKIQTDLHVKPTDIGLLPIWSMFNDG